MAMRSYVAVYVCYVHTCFVLCGLQITYHQVTKLLVGWSVIVDCRYTQFYGRNGHSSRE